MKTSSENRLLSTISDLLAERVPPGWSVESQSGEDPSSATLRISSKEGRERILPVRFANRLSPRAAQGHDEFRDSIVVSPYLTASVRRILEEQGTSYVDQTGNMRVIVDEPGLFILAQGADTNPWPLKRRSSLRGVKAARVVIVLAKKRPPIGVRELAQLAETDPGYVSRLLKMLDEEAIVDRTPLGRVAKVDWRRLLEHWSEDAPLERRSQATTWLAPRGIGNVISQLPEVDFRYLLTGSAAASRIAPVAPTRLLSIYIDDPRRAADGLDLRRVDAGANVILLEPDDDGLFERSLEIDGVQQAPVPLLVADLLTGPGRSPAEAQALLDWMEANEEAWRG